MKKILVVDDSDFMRMMLKSILTTNGYEVIGEADNGYSAVKKYKKLNPDIVTMDITMPGKDGMQATKEILEYDSNANIVMLSALTQKRYILEALRLGAKEFIFKPINPELVVSVMNTL
jgi:two-component system chemotaxis response regulator CheY